jgi:predicted nucleic acid-binding protein
MISILIDTNIILDFLLERKPFNEDSEKILKSVFNHSIKGYISATTVTDIYYIMRKERDLTTAKDFIKNLVSFINVANVNGKIILSSLKSDIKDFEDAVQECSAIFNDIDIIITRNEKDFISSKVKVHNPKQFITEYL